MSTDQASPELGRLIERIESLLQCAETAAHRASKAEGVRYEYERAPVSGKRKATKK